MLRVQNESPNKGVQRTRHKVSGPLTRDVQKIMKNIISISWLTLLIASDAHAAPLYNIDFSGYAAPVVHTNVTGAPSDFSAYVGETSTVVTVFQDLTDQPLVSTTTHASGSNRFELDAPGYTNHILTLTLQLILESLPGPGSGPNAIVGFYSPNENLYNSTIALPVLFGLTDSYVIATSNININTGLFATNSSFTRNSVISLTIVVNTAEHVLSVTINGNPLAVNAAYDPLIVIGGATIRIGDIGTHGAIGNGAIDNITLTVEPIPDSSTRFFNINTTSNGVSMGLIAPPQQMILMEWTSDLLEWHPLHEYQMVEPTNYTIRAVYVANDDGQVTVPDTPLSAEVNKFYRAIPWTPTNVLAPPVSFKRTK